MFPVCLENIAHYRKITKQLGDVLQEKGFHASFIPKIPRKMIAVKSGLAKYGRNNIAYVEGQGSFISLLPFYTDIPTDNKTLYPIERMKSCSKCTLCAKLCPNQAIILDRELIDTERCLTYFNEEDSNKVTFPDWINPKVHNSVIGCEICQINCPQNKLYLHNETLAAIFDEEETNRLLQGVSYEELEGNIKRKVDVLNLDYLLSALPRNLKALFHD
jgi:epoxyqueuosine reductase